VSTASVRLIPDVELVHLDTMRVDLGVGGGLDFFDVAPLVVRATSAVIDTPTRTVDLVLATQLVVRLRLASQLGLMFGFDLTYDCAPHATTAPDDRPGDLHDSFEPWRLRPAIEFGLCVPLTSGGGCGRPR
jgi:hypothetical protein